MHRRTFTAHLALGLLAGSFAVHAQQPLKIARIGYLSLGRAPTGAEPNFEALQQGFREHGYIEGQNLVIERRFADGKLERLPELAAELVRAGVDAIVVVGPAPIQAAREATRTIPIVMAAGSSDPVADGLAVSLARPGGNITGLTYAASSERFGKQLQLLQAAVGRVSRVAVLWDLQPEMFERVWRAPLEEAGRTLGLGIQRPTLVRNVDDLVAGFALIKGQQADAVLIASGGVLIGLRARVAELAIEHRLPAMAAFKQFTREGLLMSYGPVFSDIYRRAANHVDRILKGAKPGELPIELPTKYEFVVNLKTAKSLGLTIPQPLLLSADEVIR